MKIEGPLGGRARLMKKVDPEKPANFPDQVRMGCSQRECKPNQKIGDE